MMLLLPELLNEQIFSQPWLIDAAPLDFLVHQSRQVKVTAGKLEELMAAFRRVNVPDADRLYRVANGTAVICVRGSLIPETSWRYGEVVRTYKDFTAALSAADADPAVRRKVVDMGSSGGTVAGCFEAASAAFRSAAVKPLYFYANSQMTSGAMLLGAAGKKIAASQTAAIGSIGVRTVHIDETGLNERMGIKVTHITAGKYKAMGNPAQPLSQEAKDYFQGHMDTIYTLFVDAVAKYRKMTTEAVLAAADGKIFLAEEARSLGLIDLIVDDLDQFISIVSQEDTMDLAKFKADHPALYEQIRADAAAEGKTRAEADLSARIDAARKEGTGSVMAIVKAVAGEETAGKIEKIIGAGITAEQLAAVQSLITPAAPAAAAAVADPAVDSASRQQILAAIQAGTPAPLAADPKKPPAAGGDPSPDFMALVEARMDEKSETKAAAMSWVRGKNPALYETWIAAQQKK